MTVDVTDQAGNRIVPTPTAPIAVALLSTASFDSTRTNVSSLRFGRGGAAPRASWVRDVNEDGRADLVAQFLVGDALIECGDTQVALSGQFAAERSLYGVDRIVTVQCGF